MSDAGRPPQKRRRNARSCDSCRRSKLRCIWPQDGQDPMPSLKPQARASMCHRCTKSNAACIVSPLACSPKSSPSLASAASLRTSFPSSPTSPPLVPLNVLQDRTGRRVNLSVISQPFELLTVLCSGNRAIDAALHRMRCTGSGTLMELLQQLPAPKEQSLEPFRLFVSLHDDDLPPGYHPQDLFLATRHCLAARTGSDLHALLLPRLRTAARLRLVQGTRDLSDALALAALAVYEPLLVADRTEDASFDGSVLIQAAASTFQRQGYDRNPRHATAWIKMCTYAALSALTSTSASFFVDEAMETSADPVSVFRWRRVKAALTLGCDIREWGPAQPNTEPSSALPGLVQRLDAFASDAACTLSALDVPNSHSDLLDLEQHVIHYFLMIRLQRAIVTTMKIHRTESQRLCNEKDDVIQAGQTTTDAAEMLAILFTNLAHGNAGLPPTLYAAAMLAIARGLMEKAAAIYHVVGNGAGRDFAKIIQFSILLCRDTADSLQKLPHQQLDVVGLVSKVVHQSASELLQWSRNGKGLKNASAPVWDDLLTPTRNILEVVTQKPTRFEDVWQNLFFPWAPVE